MSRELIVVRIGHIHLLSGEGLCEGSKNREGIYGGSYEVKKNDFEVAASEVFSEEVIADIWKRFTESQQKNGRLRKKYNELAQQYAYSIRQVEALTQQLRQYSSTTDND